MKPGKVARIGKDMRYSKALIPTVKEVPSDAEIPSHQLMLRAGLMRKVARGTYLFAAGLANLDEDNEYSPPGNE